MLTFSQIEIWFSILLHFQHSRFFFMLLNVLNLFSYGFFPPSIFRKVFCTWQQINIKLYVSLHLKSVVSSVKHNFCLTEQLGGLNRITYMNCLADKNSVNGSYYYSLYAEFLYREGNS